MPVESEGSGEDSLRWGERWAHTGSVGPQMSVAASCHPDPTLPHRLLHRHRRQGQLSKRVHALHCPPQH